MQPISSKLATLVAALMMNGIMIGGIAFLFGAQLHQAPPVVAEAAIGASSTVLV